MGSTRGDQFTTDGGQFTTDENHLTTDGQFTTVVNSPCGQNGLRGEVFAGVLIRERQRFERLGEARLRHREEELGALLGPFLRLHPSPAFGSQIVTVKKKADRDCKNFKLHTHGSHQSEAAP